ncbi:heat shock protein 70 [Rhizophagus irregularis]|uniref:Heat shock protein 70 n=1 Tax=Rhizophagus irregularis TaxID=588596 RepID=A0A2N0SBG9_9GLOM|nr:heat shock protein 70 [Rhizophagus irregularis]CAB4475065.1 unnamed protein product [Rhizophagus irregularis]CAB5094522.1 unnamed protein product [Rhizophagus irregularis]
MATVGIDLGNTYSCVGIWKNDRVEIISNDYGNRTTPSYVAFTDKEILIGDAAKNQVSINPHNTVFDIIRLIGHDINDFDLHMMHWPFNVVKKNKKLYIRVKYKGEDKDFEPKEILSMILKKMKEIAEAFLNTQVKNAVITTPAFSNYSHYKALYDAGLIAGLKILRIINSPSAAAIAYGLDKRFTRERNILVFDLGDGSCDVSLLTIEEGILEVKAVAGNNHLGGKDFDNRIVNHFVQEFKNRFNKDLTSNVRAICRLREQCERAKRTLSASTKAFIGIDSLFENIDFDTTLTRAKFEELNQKLFQFIMEPIEKVLQDGKIYKCQVHEIILVGGSTRIPKIQKMISEFFNGKELNKSINSDEAVAYGATIQAAILSNYNSEKIQNLMLLDVAAFSLGIEICGTMIPFIDSNTTIPTKKSEIISTSHFNQNYIIISIYEGENNLTRNNRLIGKFKLTKISSDVPQIEVTFDIDSNRILKVTAVDLITGGSNMTTINNIYNRPKSKVIKRMGAEAKKYHTERNQVAQRMQARNEFESYVYSLRNSYQSILKEAIQESIAWLENNQEAEKYEYEHKRKLLEKFINVREERDNIDNRDNRRKTY